MSNNKKTAVEACREVSKALRANLDSLKKAEQLFSPKAAALRVLPEVVNQIKAYEEELVKMRKLEKGEDGMSTTTPESEKEIEHKYKLSKVFEILGKTSIMEAQRKKDSAKPNDKKLADERNKDAVLPGDAAPKEIETSGSGGDIKKGKKLSKAEATEILEKALPRMGGKDPASKMMSSHAMSVASKPAADSGPAKIMNMPAKQLPKMPSPAMHSARAGGFADHMPPGKFGKAELTKDMEDMQKAFDSKGKFLTPDKDPKKQKTFVPGKK